LKPKRTFVSVITLISILGVTLGIAVLILVISVMTGFDHELRSKILGFEPHLVVRNGMVLDHWKEISKEIQSVPGVTAAAPYVQGPVIVDFQGRTMTPVLRGIYPSLEKGINDLAKYVHEGEFDLGSDSAVIGSALANELGVSVGDKITIYAPGNVGKLIDEIKREQDQPEAKSKTLADLKGEFVVPSPVTVTGIFESGRYLYDSNFILVSLSMGQEMFSLEGGVHGISVQTSDPYLAEALKKPLNRKLSAQAFAETWIDRNKEFFDTIRIERNMMFFLLMFIVVVAAFGIMNTLITVTVQKTREIGIMKALGATTGQVVWVFLAQGMIVGFFGNITGWAMGISVVTWRNEFKDWLARVTGIPIFPADIYQFSAIPAQIVPQDVAIICISAFVICSIAALIPAYFAARLDPVKALRYE
jgi:lipoprotein-releasing system permease protein